MVIMWLYLPQWLSCGYIYLNGYPVVMFTSMVILWLCLPQWLSRDYIYLNSYPVVIFLTDSLTTKYDLNFSFIYFSHHY